MVTERGIFYQVHRQTGNHATLCVEEFEDFNQSKTDTLDWPPTSETNYADAPIFQSG